MITLVRTANMNDGQAMAGLAWAVKVATYITENLGVDVQVARNVGGPVNQVHWMANYDSLADFDAAMKRLLNDEGYMELVAEAQEARFYESNSIVDRLYESMG